MEKEITKKIDFEQLLASAVKLPMVHISREDFLRKELQKYFDDDIVEKAIEYNPAYAGISSRTINKIADASIKFETTKVSSISFLAGLPGGWAMVGTIPADLVQYYAHVLRILQKLSYLYGWQELVGNNGALDDETNTLLILFTGVMFGVNGAIAAINKISEQMAAKVIKTLPQKALTKTLIYPIVKKVATILGFKMTENVFAKGVSKIIPIVGGVVSGGLTFATYMPMAKRLKKYLSGLKPASTEYYQNMRTNNDTEYIEAEFNDIDFSEIDDSLEQEIEEEKESIEINNINDDGEIDNPDTSSIEE